LLTDKDLEIVSLKKALRKEKRQRILVTIGAGATVVAVIVLALL
jgi:hypothetical protein